ncbi:MULTISPECIES: helix-turn-helix transcriptional regulator [unclassified Microbacterium]|uniref:helix-turn-helix transcriptional regulator n=1 Tax=unclassified Microbacterium TaxID=2609290 RepID=UPI0030164F47
MQMSSARGFAAFVRANRLSAGLTQEDLAQAVRKSRRWVHDLESGKVVPSLNAAIEVAAVLGYTVTLERSERSDVLDQLFEDL